MGSQGVKILVVSASPRKYGATNFAREFVMRLAEDIEKVDVEAIDVYDYNIMPCIGCVSDDVKLCKLPCVINDDMNKIYELVLESDGMIFVTPIYWYNVPGPLKNFIDRLTILENAIFTEGRSKAEGKVAGFIALGNDAGAIAVIQNLMAVMNSFGMIIPPWALAYHESEGEPVDNEKFLLDVANVVRSVALMIKLIKGIQRVDYWYRADEEYRKIIMNMAKDVYNELYQKIISH